MLPAYMLPTRYRHAAYYTCQGAYLHSTWNCFDALVVFSSIADLAISSSTDYDIGFATPTPTPTPTPIPYPFPYPYPYPYPKPYP